MLSITKHLMYGNFLSSNNKRLKFEFVSIRMCMHSITTTVLINSINKSSILHVFLNVSLTSVFIIPIDLKVNHVVNKIYGISFILLPQAEIAFIKQLSSLKTSDVSKLQIVSNSRHCLIFLDQNLDFKLSC